MITFDLTGKVAVVTGASSGLGQQFARALSEQGCDVAILARRKERLEEFSKELKQNGHDCLPVSCDVTDEESIKNAVNAVVNHFGKIDILVNNAGITKDNFLVRMSEDQWDAVIDVNLKGVFNMTQAVAPVMTKNKSGSIITLSSVVGVYGNACQTNYAATKGGVISMSKSWAKELTRKGAQVRANCIAPGFISSAMTDALPEEVVAKMLERTPLGRLGTVDDIANTALFLASDESSYITGQVIEVTGGMTL